MACCCFPRSRQSADVMAAGRPQTGGRTGASEEMDVRGSWADAAGAPGGEFMKLLTS